MSLKSLRKIKLNRGSKRFLILVLISIFASGVVIVLSAYFISKQEITDFAAQTTIIAGVFTVLGTVFTALYKEISSYYKDKSDSAEKRWDLVLPMIKENYMPWISSAHSLANSFNKAQENEISEIKLKRIVFLMTIFYGIRLRNLQKNGGLILLSNPKDEDEINQKYANVKTNLNWADDETPNLANRLAEFFVKNEREGSPYALSQFEEDLQNEDIIKKCMEKLTDWLTLVKASSAETALTEFEDTFKEKINKLSSTWNQ